MYISHYDKRTKSWGAPINLGPEINTAGDDCFPFLTPKDELYFASEGHPGLGGYDLFSTTKTDKSTWVDPTNMGYPINSAKDDFGILIEKEGMGYFSSNRDGGKGFDDLYQFKLPQIKVLLEVYVKSKTSGEPLVNANVMVSNSAGGLKEAQTDEEGKLIFKEDPEFFQAGLNYNITCATDGYFDSQNAFTTIGLEQSKKFIEEFFLFPPDQPIEMPEVRYDYADSALQVIEGVNSKDSLNYLYDILIENPKMVVELQAHTDCRGSIEYNKILSQGRANKCVEYLVSKGIDKRRLVPVGYGESTPREGLECNAIENMPTKESQEAAHQRNRRTQFKVLSADFE